ncbi:MAG: peptide chain release factor N(5)-glutamine methyltransferase [Candidatus Eisenbacteria bacterium]
MARTVRDAWQDARSRVEAIGSDAPELEARELLRAALGLDARAFLLLDFSLPLSPEATDRLESFLTRREAHEPLQYLLGTVPFCELELEVGPGVLIPRPETEVLVERLTARIPELPKGGSPATPLLVDVGTGSGAILLALLHRFPEFGGLGVDRSEQALRWALINRERSLSADRRVCFVRGDLLDAVASTNRSSAGGGDAPAPSIDVIVSNPPYIPTHEVETLAPEVRDHEPRLALDGGPDGLVFVTRIVEAARRLLRPGGLLAFELALDQVDRVAALLERNGFQVLERYRDLTGRPRGVIARRDGSLSPW